jgi:hypothetical protein
MLASTWYFPCIGGIIFYNDVKLMKNDDAMMLCMLNILVMQMQ